MPYSAKVLDYVNNPRRAGSLDKDDPAVGVGVVGTAESGVLMKLFLRFDSEMQAILDARFKVFGCGYAIACCAWAAEQAPGMALEQALRLDTSQIVRELELPPDRLYCAEQAVAALHAAIHDWQHKQSSALSANGSLLPESRPRV